MSAMNATSAPEPDFTGRTAIITGAAKGLGRAYALWLAARGCAVVASNRPAAAGPSPLHALVAQIRQSGGRAIAHEGAVEDPQAAAEAVDLACRHFGPPAIFLSNAGVQAWRDFATASLADMRALLDINLWGAILGLKAVWPAMLEAGYGRVVLTSSSAGLWGQQRSADYGASKAAMVGLARSVALDVPAGVDIAINVLCPAAYTPMSAGSIDPRWADYAAPEHVAPVAGWLCSDRCRTSGGIYHTGAGHVRRVQLLEGPVHRLADGDIASVMQGIAALPEWSSSFASGAQILPAIAAAATIGASAHDD